MPIEKYRGTLPAVPGLDDDSPILVRDPRTFGDARLQLHWAAQTIVAVTDVALERLSDDSQSNLDFDIEPGVLCSRLLPSGWAVGLTALHGNEPLIGAIPGSPSADGKKFFLHGRTMGDVLEWLESTVPDLRGQSLKLRDYEMPDHAVGRGEAFDMATDREGIEQFWDALGFASPVLFQVQRGEPLMTDARLWPHHFDWGSLIGLREGTDFANDPSIGVGWSPGDEQTPEPYYYVNAYGADRPEELPALPWDGYWVSSGVSARVLERSFPWDGSVSPFEPPKEFLTAAIGACRALLADA
ncbi:MAG: hypothetical protein AAF078_04300 [Planctomycetota bacterium]